MAKTKGGDVRALERPAKSQKRKSSIKASKDPSNLGTTQEGQKLKKKRQKKKKKVTFRETPEILNLPSPIVKTESMNSRSGPEVKVETDSISCGPSLKKSKEAEERAKEGVSGRVRTSQEISESFDDFAQPSSQGQEISVRLEIAEGDVETCKEAQENGKETQPKKRKKTVDESHHSVEVSGQPKAKTRNLKDIYNEPKSKVLIRGPFS